MYAYINAKRMIRHINKTVLNCYMIITLMKLLYKRYVAEINRSTFYRYFQDKYDLLYSLLRI